MIPLRVVVEGQSEDRFVRETLIPHLWAHGVNASSTIVGKLVAQRRGHRVRGGGHYQHWRDDLRQMFRDTRPELRVTTLFDLYGLPNDFPAYLQHRSDADTARRCGALELALGADIGDRRLIPYIQRHEFEALVLASLHELREAYDDPTQLGGIEQLESAIGNQAPEDINDGPTTAPSKRLAALIPGYSKTLHGPEAIKATGLATVRASCPRFDAWLTSLERLGATEETPDE